jgi:hypothetical protein
MPDYREELHKLEKVSDDSTLGGIGYQYDSSTPLTSPMGNGNMSDSFNSPPSVLDSSNNVFKAYDVDKLHTPKKNEFEYNDAHSPVSAKKFIERSLHDLDDLINQRRLELSELKRSHIERLSGTREYTNPLYLQKNSTHSSPNPTSSPPVSFLYPSLPPSLSLSLSEEYSTAANLNSLEITSKEKHYVPPF